MHHAMIDRDASNMIVIRVRDVMIRHVVAIAPDTSCKEARRLMDEHHFRHLPVVEGRRLIGMVSDRDVRSVDVHAAGIVARAIMTADPVTVRPDTRIEHAARLMLDARFGALPVVEGAGLIGIVTYTDLLRAFVQVVETAMLERIDIDFSGVSHA